MANNVSPGNIVVPLQAIIDQLKTKLTDAEIDAVLFAILSKRKTEVQPGELISYQLINQILTDIADLNIRVAALQVGQPPSHGQGVLIVHPTASTIVRIGEPLVIQGQNLLPNSIVLIENTSIAGVIGSIDNTRLNIASVPPIQVQGGIPEAGKQVLLKVSNGAGNGTTVFVLKPATLVQPIGSMIVAQFSGPTPGTQFTAGGTYNYTFRITADTKPDETYTVSAEIGTAGWTATPSQSEIFIPAAVNAQTPTIVTVGATVQIATNAQSGDEGNLVLRLTSKKDPTFTFRSMPDIPIAVQGTAPAVDKLNLTLSSTTAGQAAIRNNPDGSKTPLIGAQGGGGGTGDIFFTVTRVDGQQVEVGSYTVKLTVTGDDSSPKWAAGIAGTSGDKVTLGGPSSSVGIELVAQPTAPNITLKVELAKDTDNTMTGSVTLGVERRA
jgi:hypothetical protein